MKVHINGVHILHPQDYPPSMTFEIERDAPFTFLASVGTVTLFVEGSIYARGGASEITTGDDVKIYSDTGLPLFGGNVDQEIDWEERDGYASFAVLGYGAALKEITLGTRFANSTDFSRWRRTTDILEGLTADDLAIHQAEIDSGSRDKLRQEIVIHPSYYSQYEAAKQYAFTVGLEQESRFESRVDQKHELFPSERGDAAYKVFYGKDDFEVGILWRDLDKPFLKPINITNVLEEVRLQCQIADSANGFLHSTIAPDTIEINRQVRLLDIVTGGVDYFERLDRLFVAAITKAQTDTTKPELKLYEILNSYEAVEMDNSSMQFNYSWDDLWNKVAPYTLGLGRQDGVTVIPFQKRAFGRVQYGVNRVIYYKLRTCSTAVYWYGALQYYYNKSAGEYFLYDLDTKTMVSHNDLNFLQEGYHRGMLYDNCDWSMDGSELGITPPQVPIVDGNSPFRMTSELQRGLIRYLSVDTVPYAIGLFGLTALQFSFKDKSAFEVLGEICKLTNSVWWMDAARRLYVTSRDYAGGTLHTLENIISKTPQTIDRTGEEPPEISSDVIDNEFYNRALSKWYNDNFFLQKELAWEIALIPDDTSLAIKLGDRVMWGDGHNYFVSKIQSDRDAVTITCWRALN